MTRTSRDCRITRGWPLAAKLEYYSMPEPNSGCHLWLGGVDQYGYGQTFWQGVRWSAHQAAWISANGSIPKGLCVCHKCDVRSCINITHLWIGTNAENTADKVAKGRVARNFGEKAGNAILTQAQADAIREMSGTQESIAAKFGISRRTVSHIKVGNTWRNPAMLMRGRR